jgi:hypothetical protein
MCSFYGEVTTTHVVFTMASDVKASMQVTLAEGALVTAVKLFTPKTKADIQKAIDRIFSSVAAVGRGADDMQPGVNKEAQRILRL